jgi:hypothetical protein
VVVAGQGVVAGGVGVMGRLIRKEWRMMDGG